MKKLCKSFYAFYSSFSFGKNILILGMAYFTKLSSQSKLISMTIIGKPARGREYPIV